MNLGEEIHHRWTSIWTTFIYFCGERCKSGVSPKTNPEVWHRNMRQWTRRRSKSVLSDDVLREGHALLNVLNKMTPASKKAVLNIESKSTFSIGEELLSAAARSCDMINPQWAREQTELHLIFCSALGAPISPVTLREAASSTSRCAWWEISHAWGLALILQARQAESAGGAPWGDEDAQMMCNIASIFVSKGLLGGLSQGAFDDRDLATWEQCSMWPWPMHILEPESVDWTRRKWRDSLYVGCAAVDLIFTHLPLSTTWGDLALSCSGLLNPSGLNARPEATKFVAQMRNIFSAQRERDSINQGMPLQNSTPPRTALSRAL